MTHNPRNANAFIAIMIAAGLGSISYGLSQANVWHPYQTLALLAIAAAASRLKIKLPGLSGNMSVNLPFLLIAVAELNLVEALAVSCASATLQSLPKDWTRPKVEQMLFNLASMSLSTMLAWQVFRQGPAGNGWLLPLAAATFFLGQTAPVATVISLTGGGSLKKVWTDMAQLTFPYFVLSAGVASISMAASRQVGWQIPLVALPVMLGVFRSYQMYFRTEAATEKPFTLAARFGS